MCACYRRGVRRALAIIAMIVVPRLVRADPTAAGSDTRAMFGFAPAQDATPTDCSEGHGFGCVAATDPFAAMSPYGLTTYLSTSYLRTLPAADATFDTLASHVLGGTNDGAGPSFAGATGLENRWTIDGAPTDDLFSGAAGSRVPLVFLDGITVTTGGFTARDRASTGATIDGTLIRGGATTKIDAYAWLTLPTAAQAFPAQPDAYAPRTGTLDFGPSLSAAVVASGPLKRVGDWLGGKAWYAAGIAPRISVDTFAFTGQTLVDANGDGIGDGLPGIPVTSPVDSNSEHVLPWFVPAMLRAGLDRGISHVELTLLGQLSNNIAVHFDSSLPASGIDQIDFVGDAIASYRARWPDTELHVEASVHDNLHRESAYTASAQNIPQLRDAYVPASVADEPALAAACAAARTSIFEPCPVPIGLYDSGGAGELTDIDAERSTLSVDVSHRLGINMLRAGATVEDTVYRQTQQFTGGEAIVSLFPGDTILERFLDTAATCLQDATTPCSYATSAKLDWHTRYSAGYVEDTVTLAPGLVADAGLRYEYMEVAEPRSPARRAGAAARRQLGLPRRAARRGSWVRLGRTYPLGRAGMGSVAVSHDPVVFDTLSPVGGARTVDNGAGPAIAPGLVAPKQDEATAGVKLSFLDHRFELTSWAQVRSLHDGFDTTFGTFDNPGRTSALTPSAERQTEQVGFEMQTSPDSKSFALRWGWVYGQTVRHVDRAVRPAPGRRPVRRHRL